MTKMSTSEELHDKATQEESRKKIILALLCLVAAVLCVSVIVYTSVESGGIVSALTDYGLLFFIPWLVNFFCCILLGVLSAVQWKKNLRANNKPQEGAKHRTAWKICETCLLAILAVCLLAIIINSNVYGRMGKTVPMSQYEANFQLPLLKQIAFQEWVSGEETDGVLDENENFVMELSRFVAPTILYARQYSGEREPRFGYGVNYYEMRSVSLANRFEEELQKKADGAITNIHVNNFDNAMYYLDEVGENIILRKGNIIITAMYYGPGSLYENIAIAHPD